MRRIGRILASDALDASLLPRVKGPTPPLHKGPTQQSSALGPSVYNVIGLSNKILHASYVYTAHMAECI